MWSSLRLEKKSRVALRPDVGVFQEAQRQCARLEITVSRSAARLGVLCETPRGNEGDGHTSALGGSVVRVPRGAGIHTAVEVLGENRVNGRVVRILVAVHGEMRLAKDWRMSGQ